MSKLAKLAVLVVLVAFAIECVEWGFDRLAAHRQPSPASAAYAAYSDVFSYDVLHTDVDVESLPEWKSVYYLPLSLEVADIRFSDDGKSLVAIQRDTNAAIVTVFQVGQSHALKRYTFLAPELADYINGSDLWGKVFGQSDSVYYCEVNSRAPAPLTLGQATEARSK